MITVDENGNLVGGDGDDALVNRDGHPVVNGRGGDDTISGGNGEEILFGGDGNDVLHAGGGDDTLSGGDGANFLNGGEGDDLISYLDDAVIIDLSLGRAVAKASDPDAIAQKFSINSNHVDLASGDVISFTLAGYELTITLNEWNAKNWRWPGEVLQAIDAHPVLSQLFETSGVGGSSYQNYITAKFDFANVDFSLAINSVEQTSYVNRTVDSTGSGAADRLTSIEHAIGSTGDDILVGNWLDNALFGSDGNDIINGGAGNDTLSGGSGVNFLDGGAGDNFANYGNHESGVVVNLQFGAALEKLVDTTATTQQFMLTANGTSRGIGTQIIVTIAGYSVAVTLGHDNISDTVFIPQLLTKIAEHPILNQLFDTNINSSGQHLITAKYAFSDVDYVMEVRHSNGSVDIQNASTSGSLQRVSTGTGSVDTLINVDNTLGSKYSDNITGNSSTNTLLGNDGDDTVRGGGGDDILSGGSGVNFLDGGAGDDLVLYKSDGAVIDLSLGRAVAKASDPDAIAQKFSINSNHVDLASGDVISFTLAGYELTITLNEWNAKNWRWPGEVLQAIDAHPVLSQLFETSGVGGSSYQNYITAKFDFANVDFSLAINSVEQTSYVNRTVDSTGSGAVDHLTSIEHAIGSMGDDILIGNWLDNTLFGSDGNDIINGGAGNDILFGGDGVDQIFGGAGNDNIYSGQSTDNYLSGGAGNDNIIIDSENFRSSSAGLEVFGGEDHDSLIFDIAAEVLLDESKILNADGVRVGTVSGIEDVMGSEFSDVITGDSGSNVINGGLGGSDTISGGGGDDILIAVGQDSSFFGGSGADSIFTNAQNSSIDGGAGVDTVFFNDVDHGRVGFLRVDLRPEFSSLGINGGPSNAALGGTTITNVENLIGGREANEFLGNDQSNILNGGEGGTNRLFGFGGDDTLISSDGNNTIEGGDGNDTIIIGGNNNNGANTLSGGAGNDTFLISNTGDDFIFGDDGYDTVVLLGDITDYSRVDTATSIIFTHDELGTKTFKGIDEFQFTSSGISTMDVGSNGIAQVDYSVLGQALNDDDLIIIYNVPADVTITTTGAVRGAVSSNGTYSYTIAASEAGNVTFNASGYTSLEGIGAIPGVDLPDFSLVTETRADVLTEVITTTAAGSTTNDTVVHDGINYDGEIGKEVDIFAVYGVDQDSVELAASAIIEANGNVTINSDGLSIDGTVMAGLSASATSAIDLGGFATLRSEVATGADVSASGTLTFDKHGFVVEADAGAGAQFVTTTAVESEYIDFEVIGDISATAAASFSTRATNEGIKFQQGASAYAGFGDTFSLSDGDGVDGVDVEVGISSSIRATAAVDTTYDFNYSADNIGGTIGGAAFASAGNKTVFSGEIGDDTGIFTLSASIGGGVGPGVGVGGSVTAQLKDGVLTLGFTEAADLLLAGFSLGGSITFDFNALDDVFNGVIGDFFEEDVAGFFTELGDAYVYIGDEITDFFEEDFVDFFEEDVADFFEDLFNI